ncbi:MAG: TIM barrel protein [Sphaerochaeta sp.]|nr:TIM barrel protein [Sphaerochaeta sp.]
MKGPTVAISLASMLSVPRLEEVLAHYELTGPKEVMKFELSYEMSASLLSAMAPLLQGRVVSVHASCPHTLFFPNLASSNEGVLSRSFADLRASLDTACDFGAAYLVLHPGYATDRPIPSNSRERELILTGEEFQPYIWKHEGSVCVPGYTETPLYERFKKRAVENMLIFSRECAERGVILAVENLNPRVGYLFQTPQEMVRLVQENPELSLCLDVGHLWVSSCLYGFDFMEGVMQILDTGKVVTTHLHSNSSHAGVDQASIRLQDDHTSFDSWDFPYKRLTEEFIRGNTNLVLEVKEKPLENYLLVQGLVAEVSSTMPAPGI